MCTKWSPVLVKGGGGGGGYVVVILRKIGSCIFHCEGYFMMMQDCVLRWEVTAAAVVMLS